MPVAQFACVKFCNWHCTESVVYNPPTTRSSEETFIRGTASELRENIEETFLQYYMHSDMYGMLKCSTTQ